MTVPSVHIRSTPPVVPSGCETQIASARGLVRLVSGNPLVPPLGTIGGVGAAISVQQSRLLWRMPPSPNCHSACGQRAKAAAVPQGAEGHGAGGTQDAHTRAVDGCQQVRSSTAQRSHGKSKVVLDGLLPPVQKLVLQALLPLQAGKATKEQNRALRDAEHQRGQLHVQEGQHRQSHHGTGTSSTPECKVLLCRTSQQTRAC
mmetsp:Transcript_35763/g.85453  ORF Transcript_35763/g.85453 Transcript_35763/m.85453 type:complete len:202 (+) Transcript_35763:123-728(+)